MRFEYYPPMQELHDRQAQAARINRRLNGYRRMLKRAYTYRLRYGIVTCDDYRSDPITAQLVIRQAEALAARTSAEVA